MKNKIIIIGIIIITLSMVFPANAVNTSSQEKQMTMQITNRCKTDEITPFFVFFVEAGGEAYISMVEWLDGWPRWRHEIELHDIDESRYPDKEDGWVKTRSGEIYSASDGYHPVFLSFFLGKLWSSGQQTIPQKYLNPIKIFFGIGLNVKIC